MVLKKKGFSRYFHRETIIGDGGKGWGELYLRTYDESLRGRRLDFGWKKHDENPAKWVPTARIPQKSIAVVKTRPAYNRTF